MVVRLKKPRKRVFWFQGRGKALLLYEVVAVSEDTAWKVLADDPPRIPLAKAKKRFSLIASRAMPKKDGVYSILEPTEEGFAVHVGDGMHR